MTVTHKVLAACYSCAGLALAKGLALIDWHSIMEAGIKSAVWTLCGLAVTFAFNRWIGKPKDKQ